MADKQSDAETVISEYHVRLKERGRTRFFAGRRAIVERDPTLPLVTFYRYPDGSMIRLDKDKSGFIVDMTDC